MVCIDLTGGHRTVILAANEPGVGGLSNVGGDGHGSQFSRPLPLWAGRCLWHCRLVVTTALASKEAQTRVVAMVEADTMVGGAGTQLQRQ